MKITAQFLILLAFIGGVLNYGKNFYQPENVSVSFRKQTLTARAKIQPKDSKNAGRLDRVGIDTTRPKDKTKRLLSAVMAAEAPAPKALVEETQIAIAAQVREVFAADPETAVAVFRAESGLRPSAMGWNCRYGKVSQACKPEDRAQAWSVDCGVAQLNFAGTVCPPEAFDATWNIQKAYEWKYKPHGWQPWSAYNSGKHLAFLK